MGIFISWSGNRSNLIAEYLRVWLRCVLQASDPWVSSQDIENGTIWNSEINEQLQCHTTGIICLTKENIHAPWILFEAGALAKGLKTSKVYTLLIELDPEDIDSPLDQFNHTLANNKESMFKLILSINNSMENPLDRDTFMKVFNKYWEDFENKYKEIIAETSEESVGGSQKDNTDTLNQILNAVKRLNYKVNRIEKYNAEMVYDITNNESFIKVDDRPITKLEQYRKNMKKKSSLECYYADNSDLE